METTVNSGADESTSIPELTLFDLLEHPSTSKEQHLDFVDNNGDGVKNCEEKKNATISDDLLNAPETKKAPIVRILENKRLTAPISTTLKNILGGPIRVVTTPTKTAQTLDVKVLNKLQPKPIKALGNTSVKIGNSTIGTTGSMAALSIASPKTLSSSVPMTQIKTADGKVLFLHKSTANSSSKVGGNISSRLVSQSPINSSSNQQSMISKGVTLSKHSSSTIKSPVANLSAPKGQTITGSPKMTTQALSNPITTTVSQSSVLVKSSPSGEFPSVPVINKMPIQGVRTTDGKLIILNQANPVLLNAKSTTLPVRSGVGSTSTTSATLLNSNRTKLINKPPAQVIIKGPLKPLPAGASLRSVSNNVSSSNAPAKGGSVESATSVGATIPTGKILVQSSTGKQIIVASKNIIKLSPKQGANASTSPTGVHTIQLPGKGVQYVRVLPNNNNETTTSPQNSSNGRARTYSNTNSNNSTVSVNNTNKLTMKSMGGSIVPLPSIQTLVSKRSSGPTSSTVSSKASYNNNLEISRKHRLSDLNLQMKDLTTDNTIDNGGPEAKKPRYVIAMPTTSTESDTITASSSSPISATSSLQKHVQKLTGTRTSQVKRVTVQGANVTMGTTNATRKVFNMVTKTNANCVKYIICNKGSEGKPRTVFNTTMKRGYTLADSKLRRTVSLTPQQKLKMQQQRHEVAQAHKLRQQQIQNQQQQSPQIKTQQQHQISQTSSSHANKTVVPAKPLFDILKPPPNTPTTSATIDSLGGSRRKHCNCSKSQCLKLYCDCFANGEFCQDCTCKDCFNNLDYEVKRERAIRSCLERNPSAFKPKITAPNSGDMRLHNKGCNCKRSGCLKNYCECYEAKIPCSAMCKCVGCRNMEDRPDVDMDSIDSLADMKTQSHKNRELHGSYLHDNRSNVYLTDDVIEATVMCMISRISMYEKQNMPLKDMEREVMEELGESLSQIITFAKEKTDTLHLDDPKTTA